jgi:hypothetical protein
MILYKPLSAELTDRYLTWLNARADWLKYAEECKGMYATDVEGTKTSYTQAQVDAIGETTDLPVSVNFQYPILNQKLAMLIATKPSVKVVSVDGAEEIAYAMDRIKHGIFLDSKASTEIEMQTKWTLITGMGALNIQEPDFYHKGDFNTTVKYISNEYVILDPNAKDASLTDMEGYFTDRLTTLAKAKYLYGDIVDQLYDESGKKVEWEQLVSYQKYDATGQEIVQGTYSNSTNTVWIREYYEKVYSEAHYVEDKNGDIQIVFPEDLEEENKYMLKKAKRTEKGIYVRKYLILADYVVAIKTLPLTEYPLKVQFFEWLGSPYTSYGMIHFSKSMQEAFDKMIQLFITNGILQNNAGWKAPKGSIAPGDKKKWEQEGNNPFVVKEYVPQEHAGTVLIPEKDTVQQMSNFYPLILDMLKSAIQFSTGIPDVLTGDAREAGVDVFASLQQFQSAAMQRVMLAAKHMNDTLELVGRTLIEHVAAYIRPSENYMYFDEQGDVIKIEIAKEIANSIKLTSFKVTAVPATDNPTQRISISQELFKVAQTTSSVSQRDLFVNKAIELLDIKETKELLEQVDVVKNMEGQVGQLQKDLERQQELNKQMENRMINSEINNKILNQLMGKMNSLSELYGKLSQELNKKLSTITSEKTENNGQQ